MSTPQVFTLKNATASVWRDGPSLNGARTAAIGAFSCAPSGSGASLLTHIAETLKAEGYAALLGPMDGDTWASYRYVIESDGRAPFLMEPTEQPAQRAAFEAAGFELVSTYLSTIRPLHLPPSDTPPATGITLHQLDLNDFESALRDLHALSLATFDRNAFYKPISAERFMAAYLPIKPIIDPELVLLAKDTSGQTVGFLFAIANHAEGADPKTVILKTYASTRKGVGSMLANELHTRAHAKGFTNVIHALMHENNLSYRHSQNTGATVFRRYGLWGRTL